MKKSFESVQLCFSKHTKLKKQARAEYTDIGKLCAIRLALSPQKDYSESAKRTFPGKLLTPEDDYRGQNKILYYPKKYFHSEKELE